MGWNRLGILVLLVSIMITVGCQNIQELPISIYIDDSFTQAQRVGVVEAVNEWNRIANENLVSGTNAFVIAGYFSDTFNESDFEDDRHCIYRISEPSPDVDYLERVNGRLAGYCTLSDCLIVTYRLDQHVNDNFDQLNYLERYFFQKNFAFNITQHELGHMLGLLHYDYVNGVMTNNSAQFSDPAEPLQQSDITAFCEVYECQ